MKTFVTIGRKALDSIVQERDALKAERDALREALKPFGEWKIPETFEEWPSHAQVVITVTADDMRRARAAIK